MSRANTRAPIQRPIISDRRSYGFLLIFFACTP